MRRFLRRRPIVVALLALVALLDLVALLGLGLFPQEPLRRWTERRLRATLGPQVRIGRLHVVPVLLRAELWDARIVTPTLDAELPRLRLRLSPRTLVGQGVDVAAIEAERPRVRLRRGPPAPTSGGRGAAAFAGPLTIGLLRVRNGRFIYDAGDQGRLELDGLEVEGQVAGRVEARAAGGRVTHSALAQPLALGALRVKLRATPALALHLEALRVEKGASYLEAAGSLGAFSGWRPDLSFSGRIDLADVAPLAGVPRLTGKVEVVGGRVQGLAESLHATAELRGERLQAADWPIDSASLGLTHSTAGGGVTAAHVKAALLGGQARGEATLARGQADARATVSGLDLRELARRLHPGGPTPRGTLAAELRGRGPLDGRLPVIARATVTGRQAGYEATLEGTAYGQVDLKADRAAFDWALGSHVVGDAGAAIAEAELRASGRAAGAWPGAIAGSTVEGSLEGRGRVAPPRAAAAAEPFDVTLGGRFTSAGANWSAQLEGQALDGQLTTDLAARGLSFDKLEVGGSGLALERLMPGLAGRGRVTLRASGPADRLDGEGHVEVEGAAWGDVDVGVVRADLGLDRGRPRFEADVPQHRASAVGVVEDGTLRGSVTLHGTPLEPLSRLWGQPLEGSLAARADVEVPLGAPAQARVEAEVSALELARPPYALRATRAFRVTREHERTRVTGLAVEGAGLQLEADAAFGAAHDPIELTASAVADLAELPLPEGVQASGVLRADVRATGTRAKPRAMGFVETRGLAVTPPGALEVRVDDTRVELTGDAAMLDSLVVRAAQGALTLDGRLPWAALHPVARRDPARLGEDEQARLSLAWEGLDLRRVLQALAPARSEALAGTLAGRAEIRGGLGDLAALSGTITLPETSLRAGDVPFTIESATLGLERGRVRAEALRLVGRDAGLTLSGDVDLAAGALDLHGQGALDLRTFSGFMGQAAVTGKAELDLAVTGPLRQPRALGTLALHGGTLRLRALRQPLTEIEGWLTVDGDRLDLRELSARFGGGQVMVSGSARLEGLGLAGVDLRLTGSDLGLRYPEGLRSRLDARMALTGRTRALRLSGTVTVLRGLYDLDVAAEQSLFAADQRPEPSPLMRSVTLDVGVDVSNPVAVRNDLADLQAGGRLHLRGDLETPSPFGRLDLLPGGSARLSSHRFVIESGSLSFAGTWDAAIDLRAASVERIRDAKDRERYDVAVTASGSLDRPRLALQSTPPLDEREITGLLLVGRTNADLARGGGLAAGEQTAALLTGRLARGVGEGLGFDEVTIEPQLVARDTDPGARFTFGKRLAPRALLVYSTSLKDPEDRFVRLDLGPLRTLSLSGQRKADGRFAYDAGQRVQWGGAGRARATRAQAEERVEITEVRLDGDRPLPEAEMRDALGVEAGQRRTRWAVLDRADALREHLVRAGFLEAEVGARLDGSVAVVRLSSGPRYAWRVEGLDSRPDLRGPVLSALFEEEALENGRARLLRVLRGRGHLRAEVRTRVETEPGQRRLVFVAEPGPRLTLDGVRFPGAEALSRGELLRRAGGPAEILSDPEVARTAWREAYRGRHFLAAEVGVPRITERDGRIAIEVPVQEGPRARLAAVRFEGATRGADELRRVAGLDVGSPYGEDQVTQAAQRLRDHYLGLGFPSVQVTAEAEPAGADVAALFRVSEGQRVTITAVEIGGASMTRAGLLRDRARLEPGAPLDLRELGAAEGRLRALGTLAAARAVLDASEPGRVRFEVEELPRFAVGYNVRYEDERGTSAQVDGELRHLFGRGIVLGGRYRAGRDKSEGRQEREGRAFLNWPLRPGPLTFSASRLSEDLPGIGGVVNNRVQRELRVQQAVERRPWVLLAGYRFKRLTLEPFVPEPVDVAALSLSLVHETRDNPLDARSGRFYSVDVELSPAWLGADITFVKGFAQAFFSRSRGPLTWAQGYRLGLAKSLSDAPITVSERFFAGGANSVRGFATNTLGPLGVDDLPAGGEAVLVLNQELRWRHASGLGAAVFYDAGNVFERAADLDLDWRHALGVGLRYASPFGLVRVDLGFPLGRRAGERSRQLFFTLGQAF